MRARGKSTSKESTRVRAVAELRKSRLNASTVTPDALCSHLERFARQHGRTKVTVGDTTYKSSASSLVGHLAGLRQVISDAGRSGPFLGSASDSVGFGNPVDSTTVAEFMTGYKQMYFDFGQDPKPAPLFDLGSFTALCFVCFVSGLLPHP